MNQPSESPVSVRSPFTSRRAFARRYERGSGGGGREGLLAPLRQEIAEQASGRVLEIGAGNGLNFAFYSPERIERVEATEPDSAMLEYARPRAAAARVPVNLVQAPVENLPFADESFDCAVVTLVFCSVNDPVRGMSEIRRVLKSGASLLMIEHVRARGAMIAAIQSLVTPLTRLMIGNCHWNRDTERTVREAGFSIEQRRELLWFKMPFLVLRAVK